MNPIHAIQREVRTLQTKAAAPGSPFRYLRKLRQYSARPLAHLQRVQAASALQLSNEESQRVAELKKSGFAYAGGEIDQSLVRAVSEEVDRRLAAGTDNAASGGTKNYWKKLLDRSEVTCDSIWARVVLQESILRIASAYFGQVPFLSDVRVILSHGTDNKGWQESQLWHQDYDDSRLLKFWIYLTDVEKPSQGPFTLLPAPDSRKVKNTFIPGRVTDEAMRADGVAAKAREVYGPKLTAFYIDTYRCYHQGSRVEMGEHRIAFVATFISHASLYPAKEAFKPVGDLTPLQRAALLP